MYITLINVGVLITGNLQPRSETAHIPVQGFVVKQPNSDAIIIMQIDVAYTVNNPIQPSDDTKITNYQIMSAAFHVTSLHLISPLSGSCKMNPHMSLEDTAVSITQVYTCKCASIRIGMCGYTHGIIRTNLCGCTYKSLHYTYKSRIRYRVTRIQTNVSSLIAYCINNQARLYCSSN